MIQCGHRTWTDLIWFWNQPSIKLSTFSTRRPKSLPTNQIHQSLVTVSNQPASHS